MPQVHNLAGGDLPIVERLRKHKWRNSPAGALRTKTFVNPDGPEAAATITALVDALDGLVGAVIKDANGEFGISGYTSARLSDAREALAKVRSQQ